MVMQKTGFCIEPIFGALLGHPPHFLSFNNKKYRERHQVASYFKKSTKIKRFQCNVCGLTD